MSKVLVAVPGLGVLALEPEIYRQALVEGAGLVGAAAPAAAADDEPLLDAEQLSKVLTKKYISMFRYQAA
jgi:hypothetical protein